MPFSIPRTFSPLTSPIPSASPRRRRRCAPFVDRHAELAGRLEIPGIQRSFELKRADVSRVAGQVSLRRAGGGQDLPAHRPGQRRGKFHRRSFHGRNRQRRRPRPNCSSFWRRWPMKKSPCKPSRPNSPGASTRAWITSATSAQFEREFSEDLAVIAFAVKNYGLPQNLKLSVHSGSDKFSIYQPIRRALAKFNAGLHLKTAGTTWLEELIGLAEAGGDGLALAKEIYAQALDHRAELCAPYASVIDIDPAKLPAQGPSRPLDLRAIRRRAPSRPALRGIQPAFPPVAARRLQNRRPTRPALPENAGRLRGHRRPATSPSTCSSATSNHFCWIEKHLALKTSTRLF